MAVDPYVPTQAEDAPRESSRIPPAQGWKAVRPGDLPPGQSTRPAAGNLFGTPGPDSGYALRLTQRFHDRLEIVAPETEHDAVALAAELAMRRAALLGRAPVLVDLELAFTLFGWLGGASPELREWRRLTVAGLDHDYPRRRALVDAVPEATLRLKPGEDVRAALGNWRALLGIPVAVLHSPNG
ncbi:MAG: hypothetical protein ACRDYV_08710 [Acidimicrobiia bacterium]